MLNVLSPIKYSVSCRLCLKGGMVVQNKVVDSIQDLAKAFTGYQEEVLVGVL